MRTSVLLLAALLTASAHAQWSSDPNTNLVIADRPNGQATPKVRIFSDGSCAVSFIGNVGNGFDTFLQRLDRGGSEVWAHNGIMVDDSHYSSSQDYGFDIDADGNMYLAFRNDTSGVIQVGVQKISPAGVPQWNGGAAVLVTSVASSIFIGNPHLCVTSDGGIAVGWSQNSAIGVQKLDSNGARQWAAGGIVLTPTTGSYSFAEIKPGEDGSAIALWVRPTGNINSPRHLYSQKFAADGSQLWNSGNPRIVYDGGSVQNGYFPTFHSDGAGGAVFGWYENSGSRYARVQRIDSSGTELYAHNGVPSAITAGRIHLDPSIAFNAATGEIFMLWNQSTTGTQSTWGTYAQKFVNGERQWSDDGVEIVGLTSAQTSFARCVLSGDGMMGFWFTKPGFTATPLTVRGTRLSNSGEFVWSPRILEVSPTLSDKGRLDAASSPQGCAYVVWHDSRTGNQNVMGQSIMPDGTLGACPAPCPADYNMDGGVDGADVDAFFTDWEAGSSNADVNGDGGTDGADVQTFFIAWEAGGCS